MGRRRFVQDIKTQVYGKIFGEPWTRCSIYMHSEKDEPDFCSGAEGQHNRYGCNACRMYAEDWREKQDQGYTVI